MSDPREVFPVIADQATGEGQLLTGKEQGEAAAGAKGIMVFPFKDAAGNVQLLTLVGGKVPVTSEGAGIPKSNRDEDADGSASLVDVASIALTALKTYSSIQWTVSCRRDSLFQLVQVDDVTETILGDIIVGPGQYTFQEIMDKKEIVAGATGDQFLKVVAKNFEALSALRANLSCVENVDA